MLIQFKFNFVQQCIQISTRINSTSVHTYICVCFIRNVSSIRIYILIDPIFNNSFITTNNRLYGIQCKWSLGAIVRTILNPIQPITFEKKIQSQPHLVSSPLQPCCCYKNRSRSSPLGTALQRNCVIKMSPKI